MDYKFEEESEQYHSMGSPMDGTPPGLKTDRDNLIKDNLGRYCLKTFEMALSDYLSIPIGRGTHCRQYTDFFPSPMAPRRPSVALSSPKRQKVCASSVM